ncbi:hypothetical protein GY45DRAFT_1331753 [Cubamyces sp. BRFM 1775]|nr:hypothetical protein GY45DRAFT_1331753 [Cubamyces sp. BRFM 1775]
MQFKFFTLAALSTVFLMVPSATMADSMSCYSVGGCQHCVDRNGMQDARQLFCGTQNWENANLEFELEGGLGSMTLLGAAFTSAQQCFDAFDSIMQSCYGTRDGGVYSFNNGADATFNLDFCNCE